MGDIKQSIVGILAPEGFGYKFAGTGFLVHDHLILTCAHVANLLYQVDGRIFVQFKGQSQPVEAKRIAYSPDNQDDIAVLQVAELPETITPLPLAESKNCRSHRFTAFGYLQQGEFDALFAKGEIFERVTDKNEREFLQLYSEQVMHGYSGCPVWDETEKAVVGMVTKGLELKVHRPKDGRIYSDQQAHFGTSFATPTETLQKVYPSLRLRHTQPVTTGWHFAHHYGDRPNFTGRQAEREMLTAWLNGQDHTLFILCALGGFGKSALAWHWLHNDVAPADFPNAVWWSFYEGDASFDNFLRDTLEYLGVADAKTLNPRQQVYVLLGKLQDAGVLLVLDGFERTLRLFSGMGAAYQGDGNSEKDAETEARGRDCVSPAAEDFLRGLTDPRLRAKVLMTTRLCPHVLAGHDHDLQARCREVQLTALQPADAYIFLTEKEKITATRAEVEAACAPYDYHPLSLNLLAGLIKKDFEYPRDIRAAQKYLLGEIKNHKEHILKAAYETLPADRQQLLSKLACFRGSVTYETVKTVFAPEHLDEALNDLQERGLLQISNPQSQNHQIRQSPTFDLHPIVRRYAYERLTGADRAAAHTRLVDYFAAVPEREKIETLDDLALAIELYYHIVQTGKFDEAIVLFIDRLNRATFYQFGAYQLRIELMLALFPDGEDKPPRLKDESDQAWTLNALAGDYALSGQPRRAVSLAEMQIAMREKAGPKINVAIGLSNVATQQLIIGMLAGAERSLRHSIELCREIGDEFWEAVCHQELGQLLSYRGLWLRAEQELDAGLKLFEEQRDIQSQGIVWSYRASWHLLGGRWAMDDRPLSTVNSASSALECARRALELADEDARTNAPTPRDYIRAHWLLGAAYLGVSTRTVHSTSDLEKAETHLGEALHRCRGINLVEAEAEILLELAKLSFAYGLRAKNSPASPAQEAEKYFDESLRLADEALVISERSGYALQGADVHLWLAVLALEGLRLEGEKEMSKEACALQHAQQAKQLATGWEEVDGKIVYDTTGEVVYKVAYDDASELIERLKDEG